MIIVPTSDLLDVFSFILIFGGTMGDVWVQNKGLQDLAGVLGDERKCSFFLCGFPF